MYVYIGIYTAYTDITCLSFVCITMIVFLCTCIHYGLLHMYILCTVCSGCLLYHYIYSSRYVSLERVTQVLLDFVQDSSKDLSVRLPVLAVIEQVPVMWSTLCVYL